MAGSMSALEVIKPLGYAYGGYKALSLIGGDSTARGLPGDILRVGGSLAVAGIGLGYASNTFGLSQFAEDGVQYFHQGIRNTLKSSGIASAVFQVNKSSKSALVDFMGENMYNTGVTSREMKGFYSLFGLKEARKELGLKAGETFKLGLKAASANVSRWGSKSLEYLEEFAGKGGLLKLGVAVGVATIGSSLFDSLLGAPRRRLSSRNFL